MVKKFISFFEPFQLTETVKGNRSQIALPTRGKSAVFGINSIFSVQIKMIFDFLYCLTAILDMFQRR